MPNTKIKKLKILMVVGYYYPYISGLSEYVKRLSEGLAKKGHEVVVLTSQHEKSLCKKETINGVNVVRCPYMFKFGKGLVMPFFASSACKLSKNCDITNIHLPLFEAGLINSISKNTITTYHCDLSLDAGFLSKLIEKLYYISAGSCLKNTGTIVTYTEDYAKHSRLLKNYLKKCDYVFPPIDENHFNKVDTSDFKKKYNIAGTKIIGFAGRFVHEKGIPWLLKSIPYVVKKYPDAKFVFAGEYKNIAGGSILSQLDEMIAKYRKNIMLLGNVSYEDLPKFYSCCDVLALPSIDPLEAFGIVQVESMYCKTPVVASNLPGVRVPIQKTGMGLLTEPKNEKGLAENIMKILSNKNKYTKDKRKLVAIFGIKKTIDFYEKLYNKRKNIRNI